jgi:hypothetical protein
LDERALTHGSAVLAGMADQASEGDR